VVVGMALVIKGEMKNQYLICFVYTERQRLRSKQRVVEAKTLNEAIEKLRQEFGADIKVTSCAKVLI